MNHIKVIDYDHETSPHPQTKEAQHEESTAPYRLRESGPPDRDPPGLPDQPSEGDSGGGREESEQEGDQEEPTAQARKRGRTKHLTRQKLHNAVVVAQDAGILPPAPTHPPVYPATLEDPVVGQLLESIVRNDFKEICETLGIRRHTVYQWAHRDTPEGFRAAYKEARIIQQEHFADRLLEISAGKDRNPEERDAAGAVYRDQLETRNIQWLMSRRDPANWGDRTEVTSGGKPLAPQIIVIGNQKIQF